MNKRYLGAAALGLFAVFHVGKLVWDAGVFWKEENRGFENCEERARITGAEDLEWSQGIKRVVVSADYRPSAKGEHSPSGAIYTFDPEGKAPAERVSPDLPFPFHPHGIALWETSEGPRLFAINHREEESTIEIFRWEKKRFVYEETLRDPLLITPNDILALGPRTFYLSHDHGSRSHFAQSLEHYARWGRGYLTHFDGRKFQKVAGGVFFANGLSFDGGHALLYVAAMLEKAVRVYDVKNPLEPRYLRSISLPAGPDNIKPSGDGALWIAGHPQILKLKKHSEDHAVKAPTVIMRVAHPESDDAKAETLMVDDGQRLAASSVALFLTPRVFLGSIYDDKILACTPPATSP